MGKRVLTTEKIRRMLNDIERQKAIIVVSRDKIRTHLEGLEDLVNSLDYGVESIEEGTRSIESGMDEISTMI